MKDHNVPEEKLLRLIRGEKKPSLQPHSTNSPATGPISSPAGNAQPTIKATRKDYAAALHILLGMLRSKTTLWVLLLLPIIFLAASFVYSLAGFPRVAVSVLPQETVEDPLSITSSPETQHLDFYLEPVKSRSIFTSLVTEESQLSSIISDTESIKDLTLVGIISGENPQAIIEDKKAQKNYTVTQGQLIGSFKVEEILEGKVILSGKNQRYELSI
jgi:hypothetical protein